ncbi:hypothetical protein DAH66_17505 [Sphingomonas koreensis]|uniref:Uncharacterized protein n=1 Tax=Sphingomonas koreensis TaxID=93064 RepID=A0A430FZQ9_9SPHN|nr:hypothetical protein [Sphingomonas koreensis]RSY79362.1 hypothetical protein DAH66_17505 [Sphingomonas koreensis]
MSRKLIVAMLLVVSAGVVTWRCVPGDEEAAGLVAMAPDAAPSAAVAADLRLPRLRDAGVERVRAMLAAATLRETQSGDAEQTAAAILELPGGEIVRVEEGRLLMQVAVLRAVSDSDAVFAIGGTQIRLPLAPDTQAGAPPGGIAGLDSNAPGKADPAFARR